MHFISKNLKGLIVQKFNFKEFKGVWTKYFSPTLNHPRNKSPKKTDSMVAIIYKRQ
ncbi:hypothetical protein RhiirC2_789182 [Rhizophagus irregularis]|uniref:Uncharacterized protein n=1 Tax=Rhizophagus irregularis TaxID=588596 RepID=A0A2N1MNN3_9GLOM|nr:hypothetical protein RhiirC2_789182 [Rhizophagus irregularis]